MSRQMSRRAVLKVMGMTTLSGALAACVPIQAPTPAPTLAPTPAPAAISPDDEARLQRIEDFLNVYHESGYFSGAVLIARDGEILFNKAWGLADRQNEIPNTPQTIFRVGEITMQFTAAAILLLEQEGKLDVQEPISAYYAEAPEAWQGIALHHLLSHSSGIPDYVDTGAAYDFTKEGATPEQLVALFRDLPLQSAPGEKREFNHADFVIAGLIIERLSGQPYGDFLKEHLFDPLQMTASGYGDPSGPMALGYQTGFTKAPVSYDVSSLYAAGGCYSTAEELYRWNEALYNGEVLNDAQTQKMLTPHIYDEVDDFWAGYGIALIERHQRKVWAHVGGPNGYSSLLMRYFDDRVTLLVLGNQDMDLYFAANDLGAFLFDAT